jgi:hypothetical protein
MVTANSYINAGGFESGWLGEELWCESVYDFTVDTGAHTTNYDLMTIPSGSVVVDGYCWVEVAATDAAGASRVMVGITGVGSANQVLAATAVGALTINTVLALAAKFYTGATDVKISLNIATAVLLSGKIHVALKYKKA